MAQDRQILGSMADPHPTRIFTKGQVEHPMELVVDGPVVAHRRQQLGGVPDPAALIATQPSAFV